MKNVAATSGQSVSLATAFLVVGNTWEGTCAGSDTVLNFFLSSSYKRNSLSFSTKQVHVLKNTRSVRARKKKMQKIEKISTGKTVLRDGCCGCVVQGRSCRKSRTTILKRLETWQLLKAAFSA
jgi:hypothetical protein